MFIWSYNIIDRIFDLIVRILLGQIGFLRPFAWLAIWAFKLPTFPIIILGWAMTIITETMAFPLGGWMIIFGGSGCYLRWGYHCHWPNGKRIKDRSYWQIADLAWLAKSPSSYKDLPTDYDSLNSLLKAEGEARRRVINHASPIYYA